VGNTLTRTAQPLTTIDDATEAGRLAAIGALVAGFWRRRGHELALGLILPAWFLHGLVDIDWDFVAVTGPALLVAGALVGRPPRRRVSPFAPVVAAGVGLGVFVCLLLPWLGHRWANVDPTRASAIASTKRALAADPLLVDAVTNEAFAYQLRDDNQRAYDLYVRATKMQPDNPDTWRFLGKFLLDYGCPRLAYPALQRYTDLDDHNQPWLGADDKDTALRYVNSGKPDPRYCGG
jgi:hypothetical protein